MRPVFLRLRAILIVALALPPLTAQASQPGQWLYADDTDFRRGNLEGLTLHPTLGLGVAPKLSRSEVDAEFIHCWLRDGQKLWLGTGLQGKLFVVEAGKSRLVAKLDAPLVSALASDGEGGVYAGLIGKGEVVHVGADGKVTSLVKLVREAAAGDASDKDGRKDEATADKKAADKGLEKAEADRAPGNDDPNAPRHIWALVKAGSTLYAGTGPGGRVFAIDLGTGKSRIYAESGADHVITLLQDGEALLAGTSDPATIVRIDGEKQVRTIAAFPGVEVRSLARAGKTLYAAVNGGQTAAALASMKPTSDRPGQHGSMPKGPTGNKSGKDAQAKGKGAVWKRTEDGVVQRMFVSPEGMISEIAVLGNSVLASAARGGRVVVGDDFGDIQTLFDVKEEEVLGVEVGAKGPVTLLTGKSAAVYTVAGAESSAYFTTETLMETGTAVWGRVEAIGEGTLEVETRSGFSEVAGDTWSPWQTLKNGASQSPPATFLQARVKLSSNSRLTELRIYRQVANRTPILTKIDSSLNKAKGTINLSWQAEDADGDVLGFVVKYRMRGTKQWISLHDRFYDKKSMELVPTDMPDGWYEAHIEVTDLPTNGPRTARATARISKPFLVDRGRPEITAELKGHFVLGLAHDAVSRIVKVEVGIDGDPMLQAAARDGIFDSNHEGFEIELPPAALTGAHTILLQVTDEGGNTAALRLLTP